MLEDKPFNKNYNKNNNSKKEDFSYIKELLENYPIGYSFKEILDEKYGYEDNALKDELMSEYNRYLNFKIEKEETERMREYWNELKNQQNKKEKDIILKPHELAIFDILKLEMNRENILKIKNRLLALNWNKYSKFQNLDNYWVGVLANTLSKKFLKNLAKKNINKNIINKYADFFKKYYYNK